MGYDSWYFAKLDFATDFDEKMRRLIGEISSFLGEPEPLEIERKFLIHYPDLKWLEEQKNCRKVDIIQTYLQSNSEEEIRVRQRGQRGHYVYFQTIKRAVSETTRVEIEQRLTKEEYLRLLMNADTTRRQIRKTRYCLMYQNQYFEIDIFPFWKDQAICEIELADEHAQIALPPEMKVIREVTNDPAYRNAALAQI